MTSPSGVFHKTWALARLDAGSVEVAAWPSGLEDAGAIPGGAAAGAWLLARHPGSLVLACGPLTGSATPGAGLLVATCAGRDGKPAHTPLLLRHGPALKAAGVDFLVITGQAATPAVLMVEQQKSRVAPAPGLAGLDVFALRSRLRARLPDARPSLLLSGPAAQHGLACAAAGLEAGQSLDRGLLAGWLADHNLLAVVLNGGGVLPGPASLETPLFAAVSPQHGAAGFTEVLGWCAAGASSPGRTAPRLGRAAACHLCPRPCLAYLPSAPGRDNGVLCADHAGFAALRAALGESAPAALHACARHGFDALALAPALGEHPGEDPETLCAAWACGQTPLPALEPADAAVPRAPGAEAGPGPAAGLVLGICPILMQRCPDIPLDLWTQGLGAGAQDALAAAIAAAGLAAK